ncbi:MAG: glycosyltransferase family 2 protein, partial [Terriglobia bacterium]
MGSPCVSVIMPVHNGERFLAEAIESILSQALSDFEFLIVDDGSTDHTRDIVLSYGDHRIRYFRLGANEGVSVARNVGIYKSCGDYIACMDSDDISMPERLERQARFLDSHTDAGLVACGYEIMDERGRNLFKNDWCADSFPINALVAQKPQFIGPTMFFRRQCVE